MKKFYLTIASAIFMFPVSAAANNRDALPAIPPDANPQAMPRPDTQPDNMPPEQNQQPQQQSLSPLEEILQSRQQRQSPGMNNWKAGEKQQMEDVSADEEVQEEGNPPAQQPDIENNAADVQEPDLPDDNAGQSETAIDRYMRMRQEEEGEDQQAQEQDETAEPAQPPVIKRTNSDPLKPEKPRRAWGGMD